MKSKILTLVAVTLSLSLMPSTFISAASFSDVHSNDWFSQYVHTLADAEIISTENTYFYPQRNITRAELAKMAIKSAYKTGVLPMAMLSRTQSFCDIAIDHWAHEFVTVLKSAGVNGISGGTCSQRKNFLPNHFVTRAEALKILFLAHHLSTSNQSNRFLDVENNSWYAEYIGAAVHLGLVNGYPDGTFRPNGLLTRAEMSKIVSKILDLSTEHPYPSRDPKPTITATPTSNPQSPNPTPSSHSLRQITVSATAGEGALRDAIGNAQPGDEILLAAGTYRLSRQLWIDKQGTAANPIIIRSKDGIHVAKITGSSEEGINIGDGAAYITLDGLEVFGMGDNVIHIQNAHHITLQNIKVHDAGSDGDVVKVNQSHHITVLNSELSRPGNRPSCPGGNCWQEVLDFVDTDDSIIRGNTMSDFGNLAGYVKGGSTNVTIENNTIQNQREGAGDPAWGIGGWTDSELLRGRQYEAINITFRNNTLSNNSYGALGIYDAANVTISNNQFTNNHGVLIEFRAGNAPAEKSDRITIENNTFNNNQVEDSSICRLSSHELTGLIIRNNSGNNSAILSSTTCTEE